MINLTNFEERTLFIIGNGFDAAHGIQSGYGAFRDWLIAHRYMDDVIRLEKLFPETDGNNNLLWKEFEEAIGRYDAERIHCEFFQGVDKGVYDKNTQEKVVKRITPFVKNIPYYMKEWAENMDGIYTVNKVFEGLKPDCKYLTFNYTLVLENNYNIPKWNICHIHGSIEDDKIIVGHNNRKDPTYEYDHNTNREESKRKIIELMNTNVKPVDDLIMKKQSFFNSLWDVTRVVVVGHSLSVIDMPYFQEVARKVGRDCVWHFCWHTPKDETLLKELVKTNTFCNFICRMHKI